MFIRHRQGFGVGEIPASCRILSIGITVRAIRISSPRVATNGYPSSPDTVVGNTHLSKSTKGGASDLVVAQARRRVGQPPVHNGAVKWCSVRRHGKVVLDPERVAHIESHCSYLRCGKSFDLVGPFRLQRACWREISGHSPFRVTSRIFCLDGFGTAVRSDRYVEGISLVAYRSFICTGVNVSTSSCGLRPIVDRGSLMKNPFALNFPDDLVAVPPRTYGDITPSIRRLTSAPNPPVLWYNLYSSNRS